MSKDSMPPLPVPSPGEPKHDILWFACSTTAEIAVAIILNRYSGVMPFWAVFVVCVIPVVLLAFLAYRHEKRRGWLKIHIQQHPVSFGLLLLLLIPAFIYSTSVLFSKLKGLDSATRPTIGQSQPSPPPKEPNNQEPIANPSSLSGATPATAAKVLGHTTRPQIGRKEPGIAAPLRQPPVKAFDPQEYGLKEMPSCPPDADVYSVDNSVIIGGLCGIISNDNNSKRPLCLSINGHAYVHGDVLGGVCRNQVQQPICSAFYWVKGCPKPPGSTETEPLDGAQIAFGAGNIYPAITVSHDIPQPSTTMNGHPLTAVKFSVEREDYNGNYELVCDRPCRPVSACSVAGLRPASLDNVKDNSTLALLFFHGHMPADTWCAVTIESMDYSPVTVTGIKPALLVGQPPERDR